MPKRIRSSQLRNAIRKVQREQKRAINKYNNQVKNHNRSVKKSIDDYNRKVRAHNSKISTKRRKLVTELNKLLQSSNSIYSGFQIYNTSVKSLHSTYERLENDVADRSISEYEESLIDLTERETANSIAVSNTLLEDSDNSRIVGFDLQTIEELKDISEDLDSRWRGAVFSLNPQNPDAARHFCTSAREIFTQILEIKAPDKSVIESNPNCDLTERGSPTRRSKIHYLLSKKGITNYSLEEFVDEDIDNILQLFRVFNDGTHGGAGKFKINQLMAIKNRVENGIQFLHRIVV